MIIFLRNAALVTALLPTGLTAVEMPDSPAEEAAGRSKTVTLNHTDKRGTSGVVGTIRIVEKIRGLVFTPHLKGLKPGLHGFHIHENGNCGSIPKEEKSGTSPDVVAGGKAGDHYDPGFIGAHSGPYGSGHLGDLPNLYVDSDGRAIHPVYAPRVRLRDLPNHALVIHARADNYSDEPDENGGSGRIVACGVLE